jgi:hypothetical protein
MTTIKNRNLLERLEDKISGLPQQEALAGKKKIFDAMKEKINNHRDDLTKYRRQADALRKVCNDVHLLMADERTAIRVTRQRVRGISTLISATEIDQRALNESLESLKRTNLTFKSQAATAWQATSKQASERAEPLIEIAQKIEPEAARRLRQSLAPFLKEAVPETLEDVEALSSAQTTLSEEFKKLPVDGRIGAFLKDAIAGKGDPRVLLDADVQDFLDSQPNLWTSLRVTML